MATTTATATATATTTVTTAFVTTCLASKGNLLTLVNATPNVQPPKGTTTPYPANIKNNKTTWALIAAVLSAGNVTQATVRKLCLAQPSAHGCFVAYTIRNTWCAKAPQGSGKLASAAAIAKALNGAGFGLVSTPAGQQLWHTSWQAPKAS